MNLQVEADGLKQGEENMGKIEMTETTETTTAAETTTGTEETMADRLKASGAKAEEAKAARREKTVKGSHLTGALLAAAADLGLKVEDKNAYHKITGLAKGRTVYLAKKGGRVDISGFTIDHPAVKQISAEEAKEKHLGKVRGQLDFEQADEEVVAAYKTALSTLNEAASEAPASEG